MVCEVQCAMPDVHCAVDLNCGYNAILQKHLHTRICQSPIPIPLPLTHCLSHMRPETAQTYLSLLPQTANTWRMHSLPPNRPQLTRENNIKTRQSTNHDVYQDTSHHNKHNPAASHTLRPETAQTYLSLLPQTANAWRMHSLPPNTPT